MGEFRIRQTVRKEVRDCPPCPTTCSCSKCSKSEPDAGETRGMVLVGIVFWAAVLTVAICCIGSPFNKDIQQMSYGQVFWMFVVILICLLLGLAALWVWASRPSH